MKNPSPTRREQLRAAEQVSLELAHTLNVLGITLPSLGIDPVSASGTSVAPLIDLGRVPVDMARRLTAVVRRAVAEAAQD
ncbi:hypothetical protein ACL02R_27685 [Streptomyces sp. MS19]|uniref:hypothetical protein n=1 Tax=Streptomyces sp. MS19 TaxID=3385972 RepID=UPI0039A283B5